MQQIIADVQNRKRDIYYIEVLGKTLDILDVFGHSDRRRPGDDRAVPSHPPGRGMQSTATPAAARHPFDS